LFPSPAGPLWKEVDEGWLRFDQATGETLLISDLARCILLILEEHPNVPFPELVLATRSQFPELEPAECEAEIRLVLDAFSAH